MQAQPRKGHQPRPRSWMDSAMVQNHPADSRHLRSSADPRQQRTQVDLKQQMTPGDPKQQIYSANPKQQRRAMSPAVDQRQQMSLVDPRQQRSMSPAPAPSGHGVQRISPDKVQKVSPDGHQRTSRGGQDHQARRAMTPDPYGKGHYLNTTSNGQVQHGRGQSSGSQNGPSTLRERKTITPNPYSMNHHGAMSGMSPPNQGKDPRNSMSPISPTPQTSREVSKQELLQRLRANKSRQEGTGRNHSLSSSEGTGQQSSIQNNVKVEVQIHAHVSQSIESTQIASSNVSQSVDNSQTRRASIQGDRRLQNESSDNNGPVAPPRRKYSRSDILEDGKQGATCGKVSECGNQDQHNTRESVSDRERQRQGKQQMPSHTSKRRSQSQERESVHESQVEAERLFLLQQYELLQKQRQQQIESDQQHQSMREMQKVKLKQDLMLLSKQEQHVIQKLQNFEGISRDDIPQKNWVKKQQQMMDRQREVKMQRNKQQKNYEATNRVMLEQQLMQKWEETRDQQLREKQLKQQQQHGGETEKKLNEQIHNQQQDIILAKKSSPPVLSVPTSQRQSGAQSEQNNIPSDAATRLPLQQMPDTLQEAHTLANLQRMEQMKAVQGQQSSAKAAERMPNNQTRLTHQQRHQQVGKSKDPSHQSRGNMPKGRSTSPHTRGPSPNVRSPSPHLKVPTSNATSSQHLSSSPRNSEASIHSHSSSDSSEIRLVNYRRRNSQGELAIQSSPTQVSPQKSDKKPLIKSPVARLSQALKIGSSAESSRPSQVQDVTSSQAPLFSPKNKTITAKEMEEIIKMNTEKMKQERKQMLEAESRKVKSNVTGNEQKRMKEAESRQANPQIPERRRWRRESLGAQNAGIENSKSQEGRNLSSQSNAGNENQVMNGQTGRNLGMDGKTGSNSSRGITTGITASRQPGEGTTSINVFHKKQGEAITSQTALYKQGEGVRHRTIPQEGKGEGQRAPSQGENVTNDARRPLTKDFVRRITDVRVIEALKRGTDVTDGGAAEVRGTSANDINVRKTGTGRNVIVSASSAGSNIKESGGVSDNSFAFDRLSSPGGGNQAPQLSNRSSVTNGVIRNSASSSAKQLAGKISSIAQKKESLNLAENGNLNLANSEVKGLDIKPLDTKGLDIIKETVEEEKTVRKKEAVKEENRKIDVNIAGNQNNYQKSERTFTQQSINHNIKPEGCSQNTATSSSSNTSKLSKDSGSSTTAVLVAEKAKCSSPTITPEDKALTEVLDLLDELTSTQNNNIIDIKSDRECELKASSESVFIKANSPNDRESETRTLGNQSLVESGFNSGLQSPLNQSHTQTETSVGSRPQRLDSSLSSSLTSTPIIDSLRLTQKEGSNTSLSDSVIRSAGPGKAFSESEADHATRASAEPGNDRSKNKQGEGSVSGNRTNTERDIAVIGNTKLLAEKGETLFGNARTTAESGEDTDLEVLMLPEETGYTKSKQQKETNIPFQLDNKKSIASTELDSEKALLEQTTIDAANSDCTPASLESTPTSSVAARTIDDQHVELSRAVSPIPQVEREEDGIAIRRKRFVKQVSFHTDSGKLQQVIGDADNEESTSNPPSTPSPSTSPARDASSPNSPGKSILARGRFSGKRNHPSLSKQTGEMYRRPKSELFDNAFRKESQAVVTTETKADGARQRPVSAFYLSEGDSAPGERGRSNHPRHYRPQSDSLVQLDKFDSLHIKPKPKRERSPSPGLRGFTSPVTQRKLRDRRRTQQKMLPPPSNTLRMPRQPRPGRMAVIVDALKNGLIDSVRVSNEKLEIMKQHQDETKPTDKTRQGFHYNLDKQLKAAERFIRKLQFHLAKVEELQELYEKELKVREGAVNMVKAYHDTHSPNAKEPVSEAKVGVRDCTQALCHMEAELEANLGAFVLKIEGIAGFARVTKGDVFEITFKYGFQKWKTKCKVEKDLSQTWEGDEIVLYPMVGDFLTIKVTEIRGLARSNVTIGNLEFDTSDFYAAEPQNLTIDVNETGTIKLNIIVTWSPFHVDEDDLKQMNKNSYHRRERTFTESIVTTHKRLSTASSSSSSDIPQSPARQQPKPAEISSSPTLTLEEALHNVVRLLEILYGQYHELSPLEQQIRHLDSFLRKNHDKKRRESTISLTVKNALDSFDFLNEIDEGMVGDALDLGTMEETNRKNAQDSLDVTKSPSGDRLSDSSCIEEDLPAQVELRNIRGDRSSAMTTGSSASLKRSSRFLDLSEKRESRMVELNEQRGNRLLDSPGDSSFGSMRRLPGSDKDEALNLTTGSDSIDLTLTHHLMFIEYLLSHLGAFGPLKLKETIALDKLQKQAVIVEQLIVLAVSGVQVTSADEVLPELKLNLPLLEFWEQCKEKEALYINADSFLLHLDLKFGAKLRANHPEIADDVFQSLCNRIIERPADLFSPKTIVTLFQYVAFFTQENRRNPEKCINDLTNEFELTASLEPGNTELLRTIKRIPKGFLLPAGNLRAMGLLLLEDSATVQAGVRLYLESIAKEQELREKAVTVYLECLEERDLSLRQAGCAALAAMQANESLDQLVYLLRCDIDDVKTTAKEALMAFGDEGRLAYEQVSSYSPYVAYEQQYTPNGAPLMTTEL